MGYSTDFEGVLNFTKDPTVRAIMKIGNMFCEDCRDHPEWDVKDPTYTSMDLEFAYGPNTDMPEGIVWNGMEKTYGLVDAINLIIVEGRKVDPDLSLTGELHASGEEDDDRWKIVIGADGMAKRVNGSVTVVYDDE